MVSTQLTKKHLQEKQDDSDDAEVHVKIFVEFHESIEAKKAKNGLDGRYILEFFCASPHLSFQIFWRPDSVGPDLRSRDVRSARFFSLSNLL